MPPPTKQRKVASQTISPNSHPPETTSKKAAWDLRTCLCQRNWSSGSLGPPIWEGQEGHKQWVEEKPPYLLQACLNLSVLLWLLFRRRSSPSIPSQTSLPPLFPPSNLSPFVEPLPFIQDPLGWSQGPKAWCVQFQTYNKNYFNPIC